MVKKFKLFSEGFVERSDDPYIQDILNIAKDEGYLINVNETSYGSRKPTIHIYNSDNVHCNKEEMWDNDQFISIVKNITRRLDGEYRIIISAWDGGFTSHEIDNIDEIDKFKEIVFVSFMN